MPDKKSKDSKNENATQQPLISQSMVNSPNSSQSIGNVTINQGVQPRKITIEQRNVIAEVLKVREPRTIYVLIHGQGEPQSYASQIAKAIEDGGWQATVVNQSIIPHTLWGSILERRSRSQRSNFFGV